MVKVASLIFFKFSCGFLLIPKTAQQVTCFKRESRPNSAGPVHRLCDACVKNSSGFPVRFGVGSCFKPLKVFFLFHFIGSENLQPWTGCNVGSPDSAGRIQNYKEPRIEIFKWITRGQVMSSPYRPFFIYWLRKYSMS
jgi:hypothetical protein